MLNLTFMCRDHTPTMTLTEARQELQIIEESIKTFEEVLDRGIDHKGEPLKSTARRIFQNQIDKLQEQQLDHESIIAEFEVEVSVD